MSKIISKFFKLNLRMFDTQVTTQDSMSVEMKTYYEDTLIDSAEANLVHDQFADKYPIPKNGGKTIEFRKYASLPKALTPLTEGVTPSGSNLSVSKIEATVNQFGDYIKLSDVLELTAIDNNVIQATKLLGSQSGRTLDTITREIINAGTNVIYADKSDGSEVLSRSALTADAEATPDTFLRAAAQLKAMNAQKINGSYIAIIHPYATYSVISSKDFIDIHKYKDPENIYEGEIGSLGGIRFIESTEAKIWKDETCPLGLAVFSTLVIAAHAYATTEVTGGGLQHIVKQLGYGDDPLNQRSSVGWKAIKTAEILSNEYMVRVESCSKRYSAKIDAN